MIIKLFAVRDTKIERSNVPFYARNEREASAILLRSGLPKSIYDDAKLFCVGTFDDEIGALVSFADPVEVALPPYPEANNGTF